METTITTDLSPAGAVQDSPEPPAIWEAKPKPANFSKLLFFFFSSVGMGVLAVAALTGGIALESEPFIAAGATAYFVTFALGIVCTVLVYIYLYRAWQCVAPEFARSTPGKAVGFLFIPFFNFYWMFQAFLGLAKDYNRTAEAAGTPLRMNEKRFQLFCILTACSAIPYLGALISLSLIYFAPKIWKEMCQVINFHANAPVEG